MKEIKVLVEGGNASPGPPLGPALGPLGVPIPKVVAEINKQTQQFKGMKVPVIVRVDEATRQFEVIVGTPPTSQLLLKEAGVEKGSKGGEIVADLKFEQVLKVARIKLKEMNVASLKSAVKNVLGVCKSMGLTVEGKDPREIQKEIDEGKWKIE